MPATLVAHTRSTRREITSQGSEWMRLQLLSSRWRPKMRARVVEERSSIEDLLALSLSRGDGPEHHTAGHDLCLATVVGGDIRLGRVDNNAGGC